MAALLEKNLSAATDSVAVIDNQHLERRISCCSQFLPLPGIENSQRREFCIRFAPSQSLLYGHCILDMSNSWVLGPMVYWVEYHARANPPPRHKSIHKSNTSKFLSLSQLKEPSHRMQRLYLDITKRCSFHATGYAGICT
mgnify:FL=1